MARTWLLAFFMAVYGMSGLNAAFAEVRTQNIDYQHAGAKLQGFLAWDDRSDAKRHGVLVIHEWWGLNDNIETMARRLADEVDEVGEQPFARGAGNLRVELHTHKPRMIR